MDDPHDEMDMAEMEEAMGAELDEMFLEDMMPHHAGAIQMAHRALPNLTRSDLQMNAMGTIDAQSAEIGEIRDLQAP